MLSSPFHFCSVWDPSPEKDAPTFRVRLPASMNIKTLLQRGPVFPMVTLIPARAESAPKQLRNEKGSLLIFVQQEIENPGHWVLVVLSLTGSQAPAGARDSGSQHLMMWVWLLCLPETHQKITWTSSSRRKGSRPHAGDLPANSEQHLPSANMENTEAVRSPGSGAHGDPLVSWIGGTTGGK